MDVRKSNARALNSTRKYVDKIFENHSKVQVLRLDLHHKKAETGPNGLQELKQDVAHLLLNRRGKSTLFGDMAGYFIKFEHGDTRGPHAHTILMFDGQKLQKDAHRADQIGEYWANTITQGKGSFHNVNRDKGKFARLAIGMIDHTDIDKRKALLDVVLPYLTKTDQGIAEDKAKPLERSFTRGVMPKPKSKAGRPRITEKVSSEPVEATAESDSENSETVKTNL